MGEVIRINEAKYSPARKTMENIIIQVVLMKKINISL
jgi:hypothetical protein